MNIYVIRQCDGGERTFQADKITHNEGMIWLQDHDFTVKALINPVSIIYIRLLGLSVPNTKQETNETKQ